MKRKKTTIFCMLVFFIFSLTLVETQAATKKITATVARDTVVVGKQIKIKTKTKNVRYATSDASIATVRDDGIITAKKAGTVTIRLSRKGYIGKTFVIRVKEYGRYPSIPVTLEETGISLNREDGQIDAVISNNASSGEIKKLECIYEVCVTEPEKEFENDGQGDIKTEIETYQHIKFCANHINAGKSKKVTVREDVGDEEPMTMTLLRVKLYTGKALLDYDMSTGQMNMHWLVKDTVPPVISGWIGKNGYNAKDVYMVAYSDRDYDFTKYVKATDNMGGKTKLTVDTSKINWKKSGVYTITYQAKDLAGNIAKKNAKVQVRAVGDLDRMADTILKKIVKDSWSDKKKAEAIYRYMRKNYSYVDSNDHASWENSALYGLRYHSGNCFVYYSVSRLLLTRCGIPNIEVKRSAGSTHGHWWNYVYVDGGWYHFDTTPRRRRATFCLVTDDQLSAYSRAAGNSHIWDKSLIPKGATKKISAVHWGRSY